MSEKMIKILKNIVRNIVLPVSISAIIMVIGYYILRGISLPNLPKMQEVDYVKISDVRLGVDSAKYTEREDIVDTINITNFLRYEIGTPVDEDYIIKVEYHMLDGRTLVITASENTVYWNGKSYKIKSGNGRDFISVIENKFFYDVGLDR